MLPKILLYYYCVGSGQHFLWRACVWIRIVCILARLRVSVISLHSARPLKPSKCKPTPYSISLCVSWYNPAPRSLEINYERWNWKDFVAAGKSGSWPSTIHSPRRAPLSQQNARRLELYSKIKYFFVFSRPAVVIGIFPEFQQK